MFKWFPCQKVADHTLDHDNQNGLLIENRPLFEREATRYSLLVILFLISYLSLSFG